MSLLSQAFADANLTPIQRATLKFLLTQVIGIVLAALITAAQVLNQYITAPGSSIDWRLALGVVGLTLLYGVLFGLGHFFAKYISAVLGKRMLGTVLDESVSALEQKYMPPAATRVAPQALTLGTPTTPLPAETGTSTPATSTSGKAGSEDTVPRSAVKPS